MSAAPVYSTFVFRHKSQADERRVFSAIMKRWPMMEDKRTRVTAWAQGDAASARDATRMALECRAMAESERAELALDLLELDTWEQCLAKFAEWDLEVDAGELVDARTAKAHSASPSLAGGGE